MIVKARLKDDYGRLFGYEIEYAGINGVVTLEDIVQLGKAENASISSKGLARARKGYSIVTRYCDPKDVGVFPGASGSGRVWFCNRVKDLLQQGCVRIVGDGHPVLNGILKAARKSWKDVLQLVLYYMQPYELQLKNGIWFVTLYGFSLNLLLKPNEVLVQVEEFSIWKLKDSFVTLWRNPSMDVSVIQRLRYGMSWFDACCGGQRAVGRDCMVQNTNGFVRGALSGVVCFLKERFGVLDFISAETILLNLHKGSFIKFVRDMCEDTGDMAFYSASALLVFLLFRESWELSSWLSALDKEFGVNYDNWLYKYVRCVLEYKLNSEEMM